MHSKTTLGWIEQEVAKVDDDEVQRLLLEEEYIEAKLSGRTDLTMGQYMGQTEIKWAPWVQHRIMDTITDPGAIARFAR
jgi:hypothetical protein